MAKTNNTSQPQWVGVTVASGGTTTNGNIFFPKTPEQFSYDADGNLISDGRWNYIWDGENHLVQMTANTSDGPQYQLNFVYDYQGRRIQKVASISGTLVSTNYFLYDGWNLISELGPNNLLLRDYIWGNDLSGSQQGAGGIGGLLEIINAGSATNFVAYDGNGNMAALVKASDGTISGNLECGPFGEQIRLTGSAKTEPFRFSTKYDDNESDFLYYGYRFYNPTKGTWLSRDPKQEKGGRNLSGFTRNDSVNHTDRLGLDINNPPPCLNGNTACCNWKTREDGYQILMKRWRDAAFYLDSNGVGLDPNGVTGVSCIQSANSILSFMAPTPRCWKCYIEDRGTWGAPFGGGDENYIRCDSFTQTGEAFISFVFDWWYEKDAGYKTYDPIPLSTYAIMFPFGPWPQPLAWWDKNNPAPNDDCLNKSSWPPENYQKSLYPLVKQYGK